MGCGGSKSKVDSSKETYIETVNVPDTKEGYPPPRPPRDRKAKVYREEDCKDIDENAKKAPRTVAKTYKTLIPHVTKDAKNDIQKVRGIFAWMSAQRIHDMNYPGVKDGNTPEGYMKTIKQGNGTYSGFFALLCREAGLPCVLVRGNVKAAGYEVGDQDVSNAESEWNAVYADGQWRLVHPRWAFVALSGFNTGAWTKVEEGGEAVRERERQSSGVKVHQCNEHWFLTDPDHFIYKCRASKPPWQLLKNPWTMEKFVNVPYFTMDYFNSGLTLVSEHEAILKCKKVCYVNFEHSKTTKVSLNYQLFFDEDKSEDSLPSDLQLERYVIELVDQKHAGLQVRFPVRGIYKLEIFQEDGKEIAAFRLDNSAVSYNAQPYPINPEIGFGYGQTAEDAGLSKPSQVKGIIIVRQGERVRFQFRCKRKLDIQSLLVHKDISSSELDHHVTQDQSGSEVTITVDVPEHAQNPEYALQVNARPEGSNGRFENVVNYLLTDGRDLEDDDLDNDSYEEGDPRSEMVAATQDRDLDRLEITIRRFEKSRLSDMGDLTRARRTLQELHEQALRQATEEQDLNKLQEVIDDAQHSCVYHNLQHTVAYKDAVARRDLLRRLNLYLHDILDLKPMTVSEIHSYQRPRSPVHTVMQATYLLLGEKEKRLREWHYVQSLLRKQGRQGIIRRIREFDIRHLRPQTMDSAEARLNKYTKDEVRVVSAGAGTFYVWSSNIIDEGKREEKR